MEIKRDDCQVVNALSEINCSVERLSIRTDRTLHSIKPRVDCDIASILACKKIKARTTRSGEVWAESGSCSACSFFSRLSFLEVIGSTSVGKDILELRIIVPSKSDLRLLKHHLENSGLEYSILSTKPFAHKEMTEKERKILEVAMEKHYFDCEDRTSLTELADVIGVSPSSLSELIRRGTKKAVNFYLERTVE